MRGRGAWDDGVMGVGVGGGVIFFRSSCPRRRVKTRLRTPLRCIYTYIYVCMYKYIHTHIPPTCVSPCVGMIVVWGCRFRPSHPPSPSLLRWSLDAWAWVPGSVDGEGGDQRRHEPWVCALVGVPPLGVCPRRGRRGLYAPQQNSLQWLASLRKALTTACLHFDCVVPLTRGRSYQILHFEPFDSSPLTFRAL